MPHVIEPSAGADRATLAFLCEAYTEDKAPDEKGKLRERVVLKLHPRLAPIKAAVFPLVKKDGMPEVAQKIYRELKQQFNVFYDEKGAVGRRYRRQDEAGTPYCITVDGQTLAGSDASRSAIATRSAVAHQGDECLRRTVADLHCGGQSNIVNTRRARNKLHGLLSRGLELAQLKHSPP